ncbi:carbohydrate esterase family 1 protein [Mycena albidolilacea]|uniref:feruloyl esterase n=1 Tax=Mycena albidolilacea TaxID=1033008 RepID=A0AAD7EJZ3_9AGAR|nr:carbohydrate esterase family 1 protein [Mycena albidolilacea]
MRPTSTAALLATATLVGAASIDTPRAATVNGTAGCGTTHWFNGITQYHSLQSGTRSRDYSIHLPSSYDANKPYPLVLGFHGSSSVGFFFEADTGLSGSKYSAEKILVYPNGLGGAWAGANYSEATVPEDLQFVSDLLDEIRSGWCIDNSRIYATGLSIGGGFVNTIACAPVGGNFAAFAAGSGSFYTDNGGVTGGGVTGQPCTPARSPLPVLEIHGGSDTDVLYAGGAGEGGTEPAIVDWLSRWATRNGCTSGNTTETLFSGDVHHSSWACAGVEGESVLQHWKVDDMRHCWASTSLDFSEIAAGQGPTPIDASTIVMAFFDQFVKP